MLLYISFIKSLLILFDDSSISEAHEIEIASFEKIFRRNNVFSFGLVLKYLHVHIK